MPVDPNSIIPLIEEFENEQFRTLAQDLYDSLMTATKALWFDAPYSPSDSKHAAEVCVRARRVLGISPDLTKVNHD